MSERLSPHMLDLLKSLGHGPRADITDESTVKALSRRGLAVRAVDRFGHLNNRHHWQITEMGRARLREIVGQSA